MDSPASQTLKYLRCIGQLGQGRQGDANRQPVTSVHTPSRAGTAVAAGRERIVTDTSQQQATTAYLSEFQWRIEADIDFSSHVRTYKMIEKSADFEEVGVTWHGAGGSN
jgi:hypothetical protein